MFKNVTLEMSLKPFIRTDEAYIKQVCKDIFSKWHALLKGRESISIMLWVGDGSEILDYNGDLSDEFEWARFIGTANLPYLEEGAPTETSLHEKKRDYIKNAPRMTYGILKSIIKTIKDEGASAFPGAKIRVGETFDIGPEFAISDFKYKRHTEISSGAVLDKFGFVDATATLHADTRCYAAYPDGIPEGTPFGTFLGKQAEYFLSDMGFDFLWLSNGLGFSSNPWDKTGKIFDGVKYYPEKLNETKERVFAFWRLFRDECSYPLETRGTNNSVGIDYASDGVPLYDIYNAGLDITAPPNSPWAALNDNYGLEIMGHMTRICELPSDRFPFRYYIHDPWWVNSPWYDRYDGSPCDIYLPMAISRINAEGGVESANSLNILSIDNAYGGMPDSCVNEPLPHLLKAEKDAADEPAPLVWIYPMREYTTAKSDICLREMNIGDNFICDAINNGFPLCSVVSTDNFLIHGMGLYRKSILVSPVPDSTELRKKLYDFASLGIPVIFYGTKLRLEDIHDGKNIIKLDSEADASLATDALSKLGYCIAFKKKDAATKPPTMAISRSDGALHFSVYNSNTTTDTLMRFPLGAPVLCGAEAEITDGYSSYRFIRGEHRECRVFVNQADGVISCREAPPVNARYRRAIRIRGLKNATVALFSETGCECIAATKFSTAGCECTVTTEFATDFTPIADERFKTVSDTSIGTYLYGEGISGDLYFLIGHKEN